MNVPVCVLVWEGPYLCLYGQCWICISQVQSWSGVEMWLEKLGKLMIINSIENRKSSGRYVKYPIPQAFCSAVLTCITNARPKLYTTSFSPPSVGWLPKKRRKKATIQGHQILGCKYTPAKGMESCEKNWTMYALLHCNTLLLQQQLLLLQLLILLLLSTSSWDPIVGNKLFHCKHRYSKQLD